MKPGLFHAATGICLATVAAIITGCASTGNNFDESRLSQIKKGETNEAQLVNWFGQPESRSVNSEGVCKLTWLYAEAKVSGQAFIPYAGPFLKQGQSKSKTLTVTIADGVVTGYTYSGANGETRGSTQSVSKN